MRLRACLADITTLRVDAIVNAANAELAPGGGVCGAIHRAAGPELAVACAAVGPCAVGDARMTRGFRLPARYVIHAVGPVWQGGTHGEADVLASAYRASLRLAEEHQLATLAFPAISTGIYGYPVPEATRVAVATVTTEAPRCLSVREITFACFGPDVLQAYWDAGIPS
jgi:O-acetyl-ADP-ribose deacetylase (regulator of RNase III)